MRKNNARPKRPTKLQDRVEEFLHKDTGSIKKTSPTDIRNLFEDLRIFQTELENQYDELLKTQEHLRESEEKFSKIFDITERKQAEEALRITEQQLRFVLDKVPALIWQKDCNGTYVQVNKAFCDTHGRPETEILGKTDHEIFAPELADQYVAADRRVLVSGAPEFGIEERLQKPSGVLGWSRKDKLPYFDDEGNFAGTIGFAVDITEMKQAEEQVRHLKKAESLGAMAGAIAHHFNNQLCVVLGNLELALDALPDDAATRAYLDEAIQATRRSSEISGLLLTYLGQGTGSRERIYLSDVCSKNMPRPVFYHQIHRQGNRFARCSGDLKGMGWCDQRGECKKYREHLPHFLAVGHRNAFWEA